MTSLSTSLPGPRLLRLLAQSSDSPMIRTAVAESKSPDCLHEAGTVVEAEELASALFRLLQKVRSC
jgi:hypothetical protein